LVASREYPSAPIVGVGAVVIDADRVLLVRRNQEPLMGQWSLPGGAVELGETLAQAIVREVAEETGLAVVPTTVLKAFDRIERDDTGRVRFHYVLVDFLCKVERMPEMLCAATDVSDARWASLETLRQSKEFILLGWTLEVIEQGWRQMRNGQPTSTK
jgi:8-oxo-dGTP diphosphatase